MQRFLSPFRAGGSNSVLIGSLWISALVSTGAAPDIYIGCTGTLLKHVEDDLAAVPFCSALYETEVPGKIHLHTSVSSDSSLLIRQIFILRRLKNDRVALSWAFGPKGRRPQQCGEALKTEEGFLLDNDQTWGTDFGAVIFSPRIISIVHIIDYLSILI